jgi:hypothetical protein
MFYKFAKVTQVVLIYRFGGFFLIKLCFLSSIFSHIVKKIILEKNHIIKFYKVTKIKGSGGNYYSLNTIALYYKSNT